MPETLFVPVYMYGSEKILWKEKENSRVWAVQLDRVLNARIREL